MLFVAFCLFKTLHNLHYEQIGKEVRCIEDELPFEIPENWEWEQLGNIFQHNTGKALNNSNRVGELKEYITTSNLYWNMFEVSNLKKMYFKEEEINKYTVTKGDLLVCEGGDIGRAAIWNFDYNVCIQNHIHRLRAYSHICVPFFYYLIFFYKNTGLIGGKGIGIQGLSSNALHQLLFPIPPFEEQYRIVNKLKQLEPLIDKYKQTEEKLFELNSNIKEQLKKSILQYAIEGKLVPQDPNDEPASVLLERIRKEKEKLIAEGKIKKDKNESIIYRRDNSYYEKQNNIEICINNELPFEIPDSWQWTNLGNIAFITKLAGFEYTKYISQNITNYGVPLFKGKNVQNGLLNENFEAFIPEYLSDSLERSQLTKKCLLTPYVGTIGNIAIFNGNYKAHLGSNVGKIEMYTNLVVEEYVLLFLRSQEGYNQLSKYKKSTAQESISIDALRNAWIPISPVSEQQKIVNSYNKIVNILS